VPGRAQGGGSWRGAGGGGTARRAGAGRTRRQRGAADRAAAPRWHVLGAKQGKVAACTESAMASGGSRTSWGFSVEFREDRCHRFRVKRVDLQTRAWASLWASSTTTLSRFPAAYVPSCRHQLGV
jgi:hypothetical protein